MKQLLLAGAALVALPLASAYAASNISDQDRSFVNQAAVGGMTEVQEGQLALQQGSGADVKHFAQRMIDDHTPNNQQLLSLAQQKGITPPAALDAQHQQELSALRGDQGITFNKAYIAGQIAGHQQMASLMQSEIRNGSDSDLKAFAQKTLPVVQEHLRLAQNLHATVGSNDTGPTPGSMTATQAGTGIATQAGVDADKAPSGTLEKYHDMLRTTELNGATVYNDQGNAIGTIDDLLVGQDGKLQSAVISVGGFLGIGTHYVSVPFDELQVQQSRQSITAAHEANAPLPGAATPGATTGNTPAGTMTAATTTAGNTAGTAGAPVPAAIAPSAQNGSDVTGATASANPPPPNAAVAPPQYFSLVLPGATKDSLTKMPEFKYRG